MPTRDNAPVTKFIVAVNFAIHFFLYGIVLFAAEPAARITDIYQTFGLVPHDFWEGRVWQPLTSMFLHGFVEQAAHAMARGDTVNVFILLGTLGFLHVGVNMIGIWSLGGIIERTIGSARYTWLYFISGLSGALLVLFFNSSETNPTIGASGALLGLLGALAIFFPNARVQVFFFIPVKARTIAIAIGVISLALIFWDTSTPISHPGHLGGLLGGLLYSRFALGLKVAGRERLPSEPAAGGLTGRGKKSRQEEEMLDALNQFFTSPGSKPGSGNASSRKVSTAELGGVDSDPVNEAPVVPPSAGYPDSQGYPDSAGFPPAVESSESSSVSSMPGAPDASSSAPEPAPSSYESPPAYEPPAASSFESSPDAGDSKGETGPRKKLQFDPETGRFDFE